MLFLYVRSLYVCLYVYMDFGILDFELKVKTKDNPSDPFSGLRVFGTLCRYAYMYV